MKQFKENISGKLVTIADTISYTCLSTMTDRKAFILSNGVMIDAGLFYAKYTNVNL